jgi:hemolysin D
MISASKIFVFPESRIRRREHELAFLPAALEVTETPPSPIGRALGATIIALFVLTLIWACLGTVDIIATATGKIVPTGRTKIIQPFEIGVVGKIHVRDGQTVRAGDVLIELDPTMTDAERDHSQSDLIAAQLDVARLRALLAGRANPLLDFHPPEEGASPQLIRMQRDYLISQSAELRAKLAEIDRQQAQKEAERDTVAAAISKLEATIPILQDRSNIRKYLVERELGSKITYLTEYQELVNQQHDLNIQKQRFVEADAAVAALTESRLHTAAEQRRGLYEELAKAEQKAAGLTQEVVKAKKRSTLQALTSPIDGVIQQLVVHTIGGVVTPAQALLAVVPIDDKLEIEAVIPNRDVGFVRAGQEAEIKVEAFNFTRYGLLRGRVLSVSRDSVTRESPRDRPNDKTEAAETEPRTPEMTYVARVSLDRAQIATEEDLVDLSPGMAVTVEIKTGSRRIISYLISPLVKYKHEVMRER